MSEKSRLKKDIDAVEEVLSWDPRGDEEEYRLTEEAFSAFQRLKKLLLAQDKPK